MSADTLGERLRENARRMRAGRMLRLSADDLTEAADEIERMRESLEEISNQECGCHMRHAGHWSHCAVGIAKKALGKEPKDEA